ncbi:MAG TPA: M13 family metallopeptidase [Bryobacteraceae bacterium]|nr:M13 family metallopeptidase [Bryobacteraceae bacterium]
MSFLRVPLTGAMFAFGLLAQNVIGNAPGEIKETPGFDLSAIDRKTNPCDDFYHFACGTWLKNNPIPPDQATWGRFSELAENNRLILRGILEKAAAATSRDADTQKIGDYYAACMDEKSINGKGLQPLQSELDRIRAMKNSTDLSEEVARLHSRGIDVLFGFSSGQDFKDSNAVIGQADQGGLGLPERDYYFRDDAKAAETRKEYVAHLARVLQLMGVAAADAQKQAEEVMRLETDLAKVSMDVTSRRDPEKVYHKMKLAEFEALADSFSWSRYFALIQAPPMDSLNVAAPDFFKGQEALLKSEPMDVWKNYFILHLIHSQAMLLPTAYDDENFAFYGKYLTGAKEKRPRWKRCVAAADGDLGEAVGKAYVQQTFGADGKQRTLDMVNKLEASLGQDIQQLTWMTAPTKQKAIEKLHAITNKIGYPDKWRDYSALNIVRGDAMGNSLRANEFEVHRQIAKIGKPVDRGEWFMTPPTVNAYYDPQMNNINFPAGILQPPFFDKKADDATNYGAIGAVIGHELTHGFDDEGRHFDAQGNLMDWWTAEDAKSFESRVECLVKEYSSFEMPGGVHMNGKLTLGENTADNGGLRIAWMALMTDLAGKTLPKKDGFNEKQRFFLGWGQIWCNNETPEIERLQAQTNPHAIDRFRVNGVVSNMPEFQKAFGCKASQPMVRGANSCRVW